MIQTSRLCALPLALLAACGGKKDEAGTPPAAAANPPAAEAPAQPAAQPVAQPAAQPGVAPKPVAAASCNGALAAGQPTPQEIAAPFAIDESLRTRAAPFDEGVTIDTPLSARGVAISSDEVKRELAFAIGYAFVDFKKFEIILAQELDRRQAAGEDIEQYVPTDADLDKHIAGQRDEFQKRYPTLDFENEVGRAFMDYRIYLEPARQSLMFERLFVPEDPANWPPLTIELIRGFGGDAFVQDAFDSYARRKQMMIDQGLDAVPPDDPIIVGTWKDVVLRALSDFAAIEYDPAKLGPGVLMTVDGQEVRIEEVWNLIGQHVTPFELVTARRLLAMLTLLEKDLESRGELMAREEWEKGFVPADKTYRQMLELHGSSASNLFGTPSSLSFARFDRIQQSLRKVLAEQVAQVPQDRAFVNNINLITGAAKLDAEFILSSAWDGNSASWKENGWEDARKRAFALCAELAGGADWKEVRELHSEFWDPPMPEIGQKPQFGFKFKGAFGQQTRNQLLGLLEESEANTLLFGGTITERAFFHQEAGPVVGPVMGPLGYYMIKVASRAPATTPLDMNKESHRELVVGYWLRNQIYVRGRELAQAAAAAGELQGY